MEDESGVFCSECGKYSLIHAAYHQRSSQVDWQRACIRNQHSGDTQGLENQMLPPLLRHPKDGSACPRLVSVAARPTANTDVNSRVHTICGPCPVWLIHQRTLTRGCLDARRDCSSTLLYQSWRGGFTHLEYRKPCSVFSQSCHELRFIL